MRLSSWAKKQGITYQTAWSWFKFGKMPVKCFQTETGTIIVEDENTPKNEKQAWIYCRVSSHKQKDDLQRQVARCVEFCNARGWEVVKVVDEIASGMNDKRVKLFKLLETNPTRIVVEHKDRLTRFGFHFLEVLLPRIGCELVVINRDTEDKTDLIKDLVSVITSFCCRLYGMRRGQIKVHRIKKELE